MILSFYMAGGWPHRALVEQYARRVIELGHVCTEAWFDGSHERTSRAWDALADIEGVRRADVFIAVMNDTQYAYRGTFTELGAALALNKRIIVVAPAGDAHCKTNTFFHHPSICHVQTIDQVLQMLGQEQPQTKAAMQSAQ